MYDAGLRVSEVAELAPQDVIRTGKSAQTLRARRSNGGRSPQPTALVKASERPAPARPGGRLGATAPPQPGLRALPDS